MNDYESKQERRRQRLAERAEHKQSNCIMSAIPLGQPEVNHAHP